MTLRCLRQIKAENGGMRGAGADPGRCRGGWERFQGSDVFMFSWHDAAFCD